MVKNFKGYLSLIRTKIQKIHKKINQLIYLPTLIFIFTFKFQSIFNTMQYHIFAVPKNYFFLLI